MLRGIQNLKQISSACKNKKPSYQI